MNCNQILLVAFLCSVAATFGHAKEESLEDAVRQAAEELATYRLQYNFQAGEVVRYKVEHLATVDTKISGTKQVSKSRSRSTKVWTVESANDKSFKFVQSIEDVRMWRKDDAKDAIEFDSTTDDDPPAEYKHVADSIGKPYATIKINRAGQVIARESQSRTPDLGFGSIVLPLPPGEVKIGHTWAVPKKLRLRERDGRTKEVKTQMKYRLEKVKTGVATISVRTEVLTPISDATLKSQLVQQVSNGEIKFDMDAGRMISKQLDWTESVIGFNGPSSNMKYLARFTETLDATSTANKAAKTVSR